MKPEEFAEELAGLLKKKPFMFAQLLREFSQVDYRTFLQGWSELRTKYELSREPDGSYLIKE